jgi:hypothetical protein
MSMPFDGSDFKIPRREDPRRSPHWSAGRFRRWWRARFCWTFGDEDTFDIRKWPAERRAAVACLLDEAKGLIRDPGNWVQGSYRWAGRRHCAVGAVRAAASRHEDITLGWSAHALLVEIAATRGYASVEAMNDRLSHAEILRAFDDASTRARGFV